MLYITIYLLLINLIGFALMGYDKTKARRAKWRIPEKSFFIVSLLGGSMGSWAGMYVYRHKTKHWYFVIGIPAILLIQVLATAFLVWYLL